jgi:3-oxoacyl-(acyl-carrier-protein) synthase
MKTVIALSVLALAALSTAPAEARVDRLNETVTRVGVTIGATTSGTQSWTVYAPSGRPVTMRTRQGDSRWWPSN